jgi:hypothetical protein
MNISNLSPDDLPPEQIDLNDRLLREQLDSSLTERFQQQCDRTTERLLAKCDWSVTTAANVVTLSIVCRDPIVNWKILNRVQVLGSLMAQFSQDAKLRIYPNAGAIDPFEIRVDELSIYREKA